MQANRRYTMSSLFSILFVLITGFNGVQAAEAARGLIKGEYNQEGTHLFAAPMFKSYARIGKNNKTLKGLKFAKTLSTGRGKLRLLPGKYAISAVCSGTSTTSLAKMQLDIKPGKTYQLVCSRRNGKQALLLK